MCGAEVLARWNHPEHGMLQPVDFVPMLEDSGRIYELDKYIWRKTASVVKQWRDEHSFMLPVSVNVSRLDMLSPDIKDVFLDILETSGLTADDIVLEITESAYTENIQGLMTVARELHAEDPGFRLEMDDFGSGYASISMLSQLPIDAFKLDMSFVQNSFGSEKGLKIVELIIGMAKSLDVNVAAEGVETEEQLNTLKSMGCDFAQGYYFSEPVPAEQFKKLLG